ncbi:hypothetical protein D3C76_1082510 [compost metagenome]
MHGLGADVVRLLQRLDIRRGHALGQVQVTTLDHQPQRLRLGHVAHDDALELGRAAPVTVESVHQDDIVGAPFPEAERAAASGVRGQPGRAHVIALLVLLHHLAVENERAWRSCQGIEHQQRIGWTRQFDDESVLIDSTHVLVDIACGKAVSLPGRGQGQVEFEHTLQRPGDIIGA